MPLGSEVSALLFVLKCPPPGDNLQKLTDFLIFWILYIGFSDSVIVVIVVSPTVGVVITIVAVGIFLYMIAAKLNATASTGIGSAAQGGTQLITVGNGGNNFGSPNQGYTRSVMNVSKRSK